MSIYGVTVGTPYSRPKAKAEAADIVSSALAPVRERIDVNDNRIVNHDKRITNLERGLPDDRFQTDASVAYVKDVPVNALPYAAIGKVGGMTRKSKNLCPVASITTAEDTSGFISLPITAHGTYTLSCDVTKFPDDTATSTKSTIIFYYADGTRGRVSGSYDANGSESDGIARHKSVTGTSDPDKVLLSIGIATLDYSSKNGRNAKSENIQFEKSPVETPYEPYFEGLRSAPVTEVQSVGVNSKQILPIPEAVQAIDGYGEGNPNDATEYNYIDFDRQEFVKKGHIVDGEWVRDEGVTDISDRLSVDNLLPVEGGGTITMVNEHGFAVPSEIIYQVEVAE